MSVTLLEKGSTNISELPSQFLLHVMGMEQEEIVTTYSAVNDRRGDLVNVGDYIQLDKQKVSSSIMLCVYAMCYVNR